MKTESLALEECHQFQAIKLFLQHELNESKGDTSLSHYSCLSKHLSCRKCDLARLMFISENRTKHLLLSDVYFFGP